MVAGADAGVDPAARLDDDPVAVAVAELSLTSLNRSRSMKSTATSEPRSIGSTQCTVHQMVELGPVGKARQGIVVRLVPQLHFEELLPGDVHEHPVPGREIVAHDQSVVPNVDHPAVAVQHPVARGPLDASDGRQVLGQHCVCAVVGVDLPQPRARGRPSTPRR